ncbi:MAG TPA: penicillin-binding transpeptidase domain-containing protein, partial [Rectinemataceae bacterium]|nr:penicillin-binding transpeptidase domain-containing protein [Rectinemataceae bacterium]
AATLAVLPNSPSFASPGRNREALRAKRDRLLRTLATRGSLSPWELGLALAEPLPPSSFPLPSHAPQLVARAVLAGAGQRGGPPARIETTLDLGVQTRAGELVRRRLDRLAGGGVRNAACVVARIDSGAVLAYLSVSADRAGEGAEAPAQDSRTGASMDLVRATRSSGSLLKPFLYAAAIEAGELGPKSLLPDLPTRYGSYEPENNLQTYAGAVRADEALARSLNVPAVRLLRSYGVERFRSLLVSTGVSTMDRGADDYGLTLILGGAETNLWEMAGRYAALARTAGWSGRGPSAAPKGRQYFDLGLTRAELDSRALREDPFSPGSAWLTLMALTRVARPEDEAAWEDYASARNIAWKTGTSFGNRDAWAIGLDGEYVVGIWVGNATGEGRPSLKGSAAAAPILFDVLNSLRPGLGSESRGARSEARGAEPSPSPTGAKVGPALREVAVCADSGWAAGPDCPRLDTCLVPAGAKALPVCPYCRSVALSLDGAFRVRAQDLAPGEFRMEKRFVLPSSMEYYYRRGHLEYRPLPPWRGGSAGGSAYDSMAITAPAAGSQIYIPVEIDGRPGATVFAATHRDPEAVLYWQLDGIYLGSTRTEHRMAARPGLGEHILVVVDQAGRELSCRFFVLSRK